MEELANKTHKEEFINELTNGRGFNLKDAELIYKKFKESCNYERRGGNQDAQDFVIKLTTPLINGQIHILNKTIRDATNTLKSNLGLENVQILKPIFSIQDTFEIFEKKILPNLKK
jgi:hypothetical protein